MDGLGAWLTVCGVTCVIPVTIFLFGVWVGGARARGQLRIQSPIAFRGSKEFTQYGKRP